MDLCNNHYLEILHQTLPKIGPGTLWVHGGATGKYKSLFTWNWLYYLATRHGQNSFLWSLDSRPEGVSKFILALHASQPKFQDLRMELGIQGTLTQSLYNPSQSAALYTLLEYAAEDLMSPDNNYGTIWIKNPNPEGRFPALYSVDALQDQAKHSPHGKDLSLIAIDTLNFIEDPLRDLARLAQGFNNGQGVAILGLSPCPPWWETERYSMKSFGHHITTGCDVLTAMAPCEGAVFQLLKARKGFVGVSREFHIRASSFYGFDA